MSDFGEIPLGLGMALAQNPEAMARFGRLSEQERTEIIGRSHNVQSKAEMQELIRSLL